MIDRDRELESLVRNSAPASFDVGFSERVASRLRASREPSLSAALERQFRRVVPIAAAASLMLAAYNWWGGRDSAASALDAALNLPGISLSSAYSTSTLFDASNIPLGTP
jgi:hypothetical protein